MSGSEPRAGDVFDMDRLQNLIKLMKEHDLSELDLRQDEQRISLRRGGQPLPAAAPAPVAAAASPAAAAPKEAEDDKNIAFIKSPMVGTFYAKANPESPTYANVGDHIGPESTVCIIEAMKVFNEIQAEVSGKIVAVLVENEEAVEFGKPLFKVDTSK